MRATPIRARHRRVRTVSRRVLGLATVVVILGLVLPDFVPAAAAGSGRVTVAVAREAPTTPAGPGNDIDLTGYGLAFDDEFTTLSVSTNTPKSSSTWYAYPPYGPAGNYSESTWDPSALSTDNGILSDRAYLGTKSNWISGNLSSVDPTGAGFSQRYGYFEARIEMPDSGTGAWPAFWLGSTDGIPAVSSTPMPNEEIDIAEWYGVTNTPGSLQSVIQEASHNYNADRTQNSPGTSYLYAPQTAMPGGTYPWQGFHTYGVKVDPTHITWYIDGVQTNQIATPTQYLTSPLYMMLDYGLGGGWPLTGMVNGSAMHVDWVRAYTLPGSAPVRTCPRAFVASTRWWRRELPVYARGICSR